MGYNLLINGVYWGYNPFTKHLLTSSDIQAVLRSWISKDNLLLGPEQIQDGQPPLRTGHFSGVVVGETGFFGLCSRDMLVLGSVVVSLGKVGCTGPLAVNEI